MSQARRRRLGVVIVGAGLMGRWHARYAAREGARLLAFVDRRPARAAELASRFPGARVFPLLRECLNATRADVVHVCTAAERSSLAAQVLAAGRHVLVEKPAATSADEARRLVEAAASGSLRVCPVHQFGFQRGFRSLLARRESLGQLVRVAGSVASAGGEGRPEVERREILLGIVPHFLSLFRALAGPLATLPWQRLVFSADDLELVGRWAETQLSLSISLRTRPTQNRLVVAGTRRTACLDLFHDLALFEDSSGSRADKLLAPFRHGAHLTAAAALNLARRALRREPAFPGLRALIRAFYRSVLEGSSPPLSADELLESAALLERFAAD